MIVQVFSHRIHDCVSELRTFGTGKQSTVLEGIH
jgi:hypothetical protein